MREGFSENLKQYSEIAKKELAGEKPVDVLAVLEQKFAANRDNSKLTQEQIYEIQVQKQKIAEQAEQDLNALRKSERFEKVYPKGKLVSFNELTDGFVVSKHESITWGEILTDGDWGVVYNLDASVPKEKRRQYIVEMARKQLRQLLDKQIIADESTSQKTHVWKREAYEARGRELDESHGGLIAEKMVRNMLTKLSIDAGADFTIEVANIFNDVEQKIDFIIHRKANKRGVNVKAPKRAKDIGVQFTINSSDENRIHKQNQINRVKGQLDAKSPVDDVVLVSIPLHDIQQNYFNWKAKSKPGGPDKMWGRDKKIKIVIQILAGIMTDQEIRDVCAKVK